jgi:hypothetical protein
MDVKRESSPLAETQDRLNPITVTAWAVKFLIILNLPLLRVLGECDVSLWFDHSNSGSVTRTHALYRNIKR